MIQTETLWQEITTIKQKLNSIKEKFNIDALLSELHQLKDTINDANFWNDTKNAQAISQRAKNIEDKISNFNNLVKDVDNLSELLEIAEDDETILTETATEIEELSKLVSDLQLQTLLSGEYDQNNAIVTLHAGAGGTEAQDWTEMLYRMYTRYCERRGYKIEVVDYQDGDEAGIKSVTFIVKGLYSYGYLKAEKGVHRLVRISPFDSNKRRHTSFASVEVMPEVNDSIEIVIEDKDLRVDTYRSSGAGGQHVNKTDSAVRLTHLPTGIVVCCQNQRSQVQNKDKAMQILKSKLIEVQQQEKLDQNLAIKGEIKKIEWGSQIRSYVFCPYTMVKDHRTNYENPNVNDVMDGNIHNFIEDYLQKAY